MDRQWSPTPANALRRPASRARPLDQGSLTHGPYAATGGGAPVLRQSHQRPPPPGARPPPKPPPGKPPAPPRPPPRPPRLPSLEVRLAPPALVLFVAGRRTVSPAFRPLRMIV